MANPNPSPETRFQPGNPGGGRPQGSVSLTTVLKQVLEENAPLAREMIAGGIKCATEGNAAWAKLLFDRVDGPLLDRIEHSGNISNLTDAERVERLASLSESARAKRAGPDTSDVED